MVQDLTESNTFTHNRIAALVSFSLALSVVLFLTACSESEAPSSEIIDIAPTVARSEIHALPGFQVELVYDVPLDTQGSWVSLTADDRGRLIASDQRGRLWRVTPAPFSSKTVSKAELIDVELGFAQGLLYANGVLYVMANVSKADIRNYEAEDNNTSGFAPPQSGLYRVRDTDNDDKFDSVEQLAVIPGGDEHGPHGIVMGPDKKSIFVVAGNYTKVPQIISVSRVPQVWGEDQLTPVLLDPQGHANKIKAPGGWIAKFDLNGENWELLTVGMRNTYDIAVNASGDVFGFDADMEWDLGTPWYRPTRLIHAVSGADFGWRTGSGKWPEYFEDSLPALKNIGPGSPTGMLFGTGAAFPQKYQHALFAFDWTFGTIYAVHMEPNGATYTAEVEEFISGQPLPLTDGVIASDGALYFLTGGRNISSGLYRIVYVGGESTQRVEQVTNDSELMQARRALEGLHKPIGVSAIVAAWEDIGHEDVFLRHAARIAIEHQDVALWRVKALAETQPRAAIAALVALARHGNSEDRAPAIARLLALSETELTDDQYADLLRAYALVFMRLGPPTASERASLFTSLQSKFPSEDLYLNRELSRILSYLAPNSTGTRLLDLLEADAVLSPPVFADIDPNLLSRNSDFGVRIKAVLDNPGQVEQVHYAYLLHSQTCDWPFEQKERFYRWMQDALSAEGGESYKGYIKKMRAIALECTPPEIQERLQHLIVEDDNVTNYLKDVPIPEGPGENWTVEQIAGIFASDTGPRNFARGQDMYKAGLCLACHGIAGKGGAIGPNLDGVSARFDVAYLLRAILDPSDAISNQYTNSVLHTKDKQQITGRVLSENDKNISISINPFDLSNVQVVNKSIVVNREESNVSPMPPGLILGMNREEVLDLIAYIYSSGNPEDRRFKEGE